MNQWNEQLIKFVHNLSECRPLLDVAGPTPLHQLGIAFGTVVRNAHALHKIENKMNIVNCVEVNEQQKVNDGCCYHIVMIDNVVILLMIFTPPEITCSEISVCY